MAFRFAFTVLVCATSCRAQITTCAPCHPKVVETYRKTGMARSFYRPTPENMRQGSYDHLPSDMHYEMVQRDGTYFQRQYQTGFDAKPANVRETEINYILGSGNHVRSYLHRAARNTLILLPLAWYAEKGGYWAMNPGFDRPDHQGLRRNVTYDCMFCHNAYPVVPTASREPVFSSVSEGIDCQRCHGNGERHVSLASKGAKREEIRSAILNPSRLKADRRMEVCLQCHLETTSSSLPASLVRYERGPFSFKPSEPLADFMLHFDHAPGTGHEDKFEITGSAYRLRKSQCFLKSNGALQCTTCHDPHDAARADYAAACRQCHEPALGRLVAAGQHVASADCTGCHMPKRRTDDVVHTVMTDHFIQRRPVASIAEKAEQKQTDATAYRGEVVLYYPPSLPKPADELYLAIAQVSQSSNLRSGIARLSAAIGTFRPANAEYYLELGDAWSNAGQYDQALPVYEAALQHAESEVALVRLATCLVSLKQYPRAESTLMQALKLAPNDAAAWVQLGLAQLGQGRTADALRTFEKAKQADPELVEAYNLLGAVQFESGDAARAEPTLRDGIRVEPNFAPIHNNLANLLSETGRFDEAKYHFEAALRYKDDYLGARYNYALALKRVNRLDEAQAQVEAILRANPDSAEAHEFLGNLLNAKGLADGAIHQYREAVRIQPEFDRANLDLGSALANNGDPSAALPFLRKAAKSQDREIRDAAQKVLEKFGRPR
jgi:tetratricopeptide (TPR) repeat protein